jgi:predicted secreted protein
MAGYARPRPLPFTSEKALGKVAMFNIPWTSIVAWAAIYVVVWWITIFAILPIGVRSQHEVGEVTPGSDPGAPASPRLAMKAAITTAVSAVILALIYFFHGYLDAL